MVFYRKYRPQKFSDLVGQDVARDTLMSALLTGKISHGYLFAGPRGTGKTSTARIFAKAVNCQSKPKTQNSKLKTAQRELRYGEPCCRCLACVSIADGSALDLIEIDAASNRGIDEIRDLREKIKLSPVNCRFKVYVIDEAHMLTTEAFNALLKTLEEPPAHAIFILCTTRAQKIPGTVTSRLTRVNFSRAKPSDLVVAARRVAKAEKIKIDEAALDAIAKVSEGSYRDALSILDQLAAAGKKIGASDVRRIAGSSELVFEFVKAVSGHDLKNAVVAVEQLSRQELDASVFGREVVEFLEQVLLWRIGADEVFRQEMDSQERERILAAAGQIGFAQVQELLKLFLVAEGEVLSYPSAHIPLILAAAKYCGEPVASLAISGEPRQVESGKWKESRSLAGSESGKSRVPLREVKVESSNKAKILEMKPDSKKSKGKSLASLEANWGAFLSKVKPLNAHLVAILRSCRPAEFDGQNLTIDAFYRFHKDKLEEPKIIMMLEQLLTQVMGQKIHLQINLAQKGERPPKTVTESDIVEAGEDLARVAAEIFSK